MFRYNTLIAVDDLFLSLENDRFKLYGFVVKKPIPIP